MGPGTLPFLLTNRPLQATYLHSAVDHGALGLALGGSLFLFPFFLAKEEHDILNNST